MLSQWAHTFLALSLSGVVSSTGYAQTSSVKSAQLVVSPENYMILNTNDGREARVLTSATKFFSTPISLSTTENMCGVPDSSPSCRMIMRLGLESRALFWTKHPEPDKIGKRVQFVYNGNSPSDISDDLLIVSENGGKKDLFICDDYRWLTGLEKAQEVNRLDMIFSWGAEANLMNSETNINENRTTGGAFNIMLHGYMGRAYSIHSESYITLFSGSIPLLGNGPISIVVNNRASGELCQMQFSPDTSKAQKVFGDAFSDLPKHTPEERPVPPGPQNNLKNTIENYIKQLQYGDFL